MGKFCNEQVVAIGFALPEKADEPGMPPELQQCLDLGVEAARSHLQHRDRHIPATGTQDALVNRFGRARPDGRELHRDISSVQKQLGRLQEFLDGVTQRTVFFELFGRKDFIRQRVSLMRLEPLGDGRTVANGRRCSQLP